jgi:hypothetical protein
MSQLSKLRSVNLRVLVSFEKLLCQVNAENPFAAKRIIIIVVCIRRSQESLVGIATGIHLHNWSTNTVRQIAKQRNYNISGVSYNEGCDLNINEDRLVP